MPPDPNFWLDPRKNEIGEFSQNYFYDVAEAKKLVSAAGFPNGFDMPMIAQTTSPSSDLWPLYHDEVKKAGIVNFQFNLIQDRTEFLNTVIRGNNFKGIGWFSSGSGGDVDYHVSRQYHRDGVAAAYGNAKLDAMVVAQRQEPDVLKRAQILKDIQIEVAQIFPINPGQHPFASFRFEWPWLHNAAYPDIAYGHLQWLAEDMPKRNG
jgi:ABC-type transport system substrate-binding protein